MNPTRLLPRKTPDRRPRLPVALAALLVALVLPAGGPHAQGATQGAAPADASATSAARPRISTAGAYDAPIGKRGGITNPVAWCSDFQVEPRTVWTLTNARTGWTRTWRWQGSLPGMHFPRVDVGTYWSRTTATCGQETRTRHQKLRIKEKTYAGTVSRAEWKQIRHGMTRERVAAIVGSDGRYPSHSDGTTVLQYDMMRFWRWSLIWYRDGRVVAKMWNVGHD